MPNIAYSNIYDIDFSEFVEPAISMTDISDRHIGITLDRHIGITSHTKLPERAFNLSEQYVINTGARGAQAIPRSTGKLLRQNIFDLKEQILKKEADTRKWDYDMRVTMESLKVSHAKSLRMSAMTDARAYREYTRTRGHRYDVGDVKSPAIEHEVFPAHAKILPKPQLGRLTFAKQGVVEDLVGISVRSASPLLKAGRMASLGAKASMWGMVVGVVASAIVERMALATQDIARRQTINTLKKIGIDSLDNLHGIVGGGLRNVGGGITFSGDINLTDFNRALSQFMAYTKKDATQVVNEINYKVVTSAIYATFKTNKERIKNDLEQPSRMYKGLTVGEAIVVNGEQKKHNKRFTRPKLNSAVKRMIGARTRAIGSLRAPWVPSVRKLAPVVKKKFSAGLGRLQKGRDKGGAAPARNNESGYKAVSSSWNDFNAGGDPVAQNHMRRGLQQAIDDKTADLMVYVRRKVQENIDRFNRAKS
jgi:hypothetical protein